MCNAFGQSTSATITGRITDPTKAVLPGAKVMVMNVLTNGRYETSTDQAGNYTVPSLLPGTYQIEVEKTGFKTILKPGVELHIQDVAAINFEMAVGSISETVTVEAGAPVVNTTDASVSTVIDHAYVENMPLNGRSFQDLILLTPGTVTQTPQVSTLGAGSGLGITGEFSVNGQRMEENYYTVDGVSANVGAAPGVASTLGAGLSGSLPAATALGTTQALVSVDDLQEFRVQSSTYSAEYGRNPGGQFIFETKSGTNQWHGTAYDYLRNGFLDAQDWFNDYLGTPEPALHQNDFGGTLGGPVEVPGLYNGKNKSFFFVSYEGLRLIAPRPATANFVPDFCMRGVASSCQAGRFPAAAALQPGINAFPAPTPGGIDDVANGIAQFIGSWSNPASLDATSVRFDHTANDKLRLFFRFADTSSSGATRGTSAAFSTPTSNQISTYVTRSYTAGVTDALTSNLTNDFRFNYSSNEVAQHNVIDSFGDNTPVDLAQLTGLGPGSSPEVVLLYGGYFILLQQQQTSGSQRQWNVLDNMSLFLGRHQLKVGVDYRRLTPSETPANPFMQFIYFRETSIENNSAFVSAQNRVSAYPLYVNLSMFAQDEWRILPRLTLSMGLRWDINPAPGVTRGFHPYTIQGDGPNSWSLAPQGTALWQTTWYNFAPRIGLAYILDTATDRETVIRGGAGLFFDTGQQLGSLGFNSGPGFFASSASPGSFPNSIGVPEVANPPVPPYDNAVGYASHLQLPYTIQWNASVEQALGKSQAVTVSYVGAHGARLLQQNSIAPSSNPTISFVTLVENGLTSDYNSLQAQFRRRLSQGLTGLLSYTWSHCTDYGSENYNIGYQRGNCDFDVRHNLSAAFSYDIPAVRREGLAGTVLDHWGLDDRFTFRTSFPVTLLGNGLLQPNGQLYNEGLNLVPSQPVYLYGANCASVLQSLNDLAPGKGCPGGRALNPIAFASVASGLGDAPRNFVRGFGAWQMDLAIRRQFRVHESLRILFRAETFNVFNHPNFGQINPNFGQTTFGQATSTLASSLGVLNPLYQMGGPRSMQFALKLIF